MPKKLKFFDLAKRKSFMSDKYKIVRKRTKKGMRTFAVAKSPSGGESWRIVPKGFKK